jgi:hypothetical protein
MEWSTTHFDIIDCDTDLLEYTRKDLNRYFEFDRCYSMISLDDEISEEDRPNEINNVESTVSPYQY